MDILDTNTNGIPKILHFIWFGNKIPDYMAHNIASYKEFNSDFTINIIHEEDIDNPKSEDFLEFIGQLKSGNVFYKSFYNRKNIFKWFNYIKLNDEKKMRIAMMSDTFRVFLLNKYGGIYLDSDTRPKKSFDEILCMNKAIATRVHRTRKTSWVDCFFIGNISGFFDDMLDVDASGMDWGDLYTINRGTFQIDHNESVNDTRNPYIIHDFKRSYAS